MCGGGGHGWACRALFTLSYTAFHLLPALVVIWTLVSVALERRWSGDLSVDRGGDGRGMIVHPYRSIICDLVPAERQILQLQRRARRRTGVFPPPCPTSCSCSRVVGGDRRGCVLVCTRDATRSAPAGGNLRCERAGFRAVPLDGADDHVFAPFATLLAVVLASTIEWRRASSLTLSALALRLSLPCCFLDRIDFIAATVGDVPQTTERDSSGSVPRCRAMQGRCTVGRRGAVCVWARRVDTSRTIRCHGSRPAPEYDVQRALFAGESRTCP